MSVDTEPSPVRRRREDSVLRHWQAVSELLEHRSDLVGVHSLADLIHDSVRWSA
ncbi:MULTISPECIES: hypothetical protein [Nocardioides]|uniref:Uncharacterized protein n=1 Tax=Nocardioides lianchengensis TaxID=1045774 RepID=A0A1G7BNS8_9ACTN|nr:hypothetical protein [Nocardioides lianchengensis]NYG08926.1 hypothetical protein [Nocardioides lianchengensis]SDE28627.1 hypothetical protein SAMN05421872_11889 [Nocardioides lianchengensis]